MLIIDMDAVVDELRRRGIHSYVEQTGGGCATIYAGPQHEEPGYGTRWAAVAGPGWFEGPGWTTARGDANDFYIGPDDDGDNPIEHHDDGRGETSPTVIADMIVAVINRSTTTPPDTTVHVLTIEHHYGTNTYVHRTAEGVERSLLDYVAEWWEQEMPKTQFPEKPGVAIEEYFDGVQGESYWIGESKVMD